MSGPCSLLGRNWIFVFKLISGFRMLRDMAHSCNIQEQCVKHVAEPILQVNILHFIVNSTNVFYFNWVRSSYSCIHQKEAEGSSDIDTALDWRKTVTIKLWTTLFNNMYCYYCFHFIISIQLLILLFFALI